MGPYFGALYNNKIIIRNVLKIKRFVFSFVADNNYYTINDYYYRYYSLAHRPDPNPFP